MEKAISDTTNISALGKIYLAAEFIFLFFGLPSLIFMNPQFKYKIVVLLAATLLIFLVLYFDKSFDRKEFTRVGEIKKYLPKIFLRSLFVFVFMLGLTWYVKPENLFFILKRIPILWFVIMFFYPILSAYPQEVLFRTFQFHRYKSLVKNETTMIILSTISFSFLHIVYHNYYAVILTLAAGYIFTKTYRENKSLVAVAIEHAIYGNIVFTVGFGEYFYKMAGS